MPKQIVIAGNQEGLNTRLRPFILPDGAYPGLTNAYSRRQRIRKKRGHTTKDRLRRLLTGQSLGNTTGGGAFSGSIKTTVAPALETNSQIEKGSVAITVTGAPNQTFADSNLDGQILQLTGGGYVIAITGITQAASAVISIADLNYTIGQQVYISGVTGMTQINNAYYTITAVNPGVSITINVNSTTFTAYAGGGTALRVAGTINYASTVLAFQTYPSLGGAAISVNFNYFPALPVMGIVQRELTDLNSEETVVFDTKYAYVNTPTGWVELASATPTTWTGADFNLFWGTNYYATLQQTQALWVTNNIDPVRYFQLGTWASLTPLVDGVTTLTRALLIAPFKGRLLFFSTTEGGNVFRNRCRFSQSSLIGTPVAADAWRSDIPGKGGFIDAPTAEAIVTIQPLKDRLIVYFERSTWELVYTGNETLPFYFRQINRELGSESTFSVIPFDGGILGVGDVGIHACNGVNVTRIDEQIPDQVYEVQNANQGPQRVSGVRDFIEEVVYWTYPNQTDYDDAVAAASQKFPNRVLLYNYVDNTWADLIESFTCYGYFQRATDFTWATLPYETWASWNVAWGGDFEQSRVLEVLAGNQQGYTFLINNFTSANAKSRSIWGFTSVPGGIQITSFDHNLVVGDYITIAGAVGVTISFANVQYTSFKVLSISSADVFTIDGSFTGTYLGGGEITVLSNFAIESKEFNEFFPMAQSCRFPYADFLFDRTPHNLDGTPTGEVSVYFYINDNQVSANPPLMGTASMPTSANISLQPIQATQDTIWYRKYVNAVGQFIQYEIRLSTDADNVELPQMRKAQFAQSDFVLNAVVLSADPSGRLAP